MSWAAGVWAGFGFETGGEIIFGLNNHTGALISMEDLLTNPSKVRWCAFQQQSATIGLGLGGSAGTNLVIGYNAAVPSDFEGASGAAFDFSIDLVLGKLDKYFRNLPEMVELIGIARKFDRNWLAVAEGLKKYENNRRYLKTATENILKNAGGIKDAAAGQTALLSFPLPGLGGGLRLSVKAKAEETTVLSFGADDFS